MAGKGLQKYVEDMASSGPSPAAAQDPDGDHIVEDEGTKDPQADPEYEDVSVV